jgi:hypothetical protein
MEYNMLYWQKKTTVYTQQMVDRWSIVKKKQEINYNNILTLFDNKKNQSFIESMHKYK